MNFFTSVIVYLIIFWTLLFMILPWGNKTAETPETGMAGSAPANPRIKQKFLITGGISLMIWGVVYALVHYEIIDFYEIAHEMVREDQADSSN